MVLGRIAKNFPVQPSYVIRQEAPYNHVERKEKKEKKRKKRKKKGRENENKYVGEVGQKLSGLGDFVVERIYFRKCEN